ncbi:MAG: AAA family ATPase [Sporolactobacillus sp.]|jgi:adenylate kinase family enzyme|nr:AAA family ATPase [Sporolactobacillus sp.]
MASIIWINGTFGSGKTTTAYELNKCLPDSFVYDPEYFGYALMRNTPKILVKSNFQYDPEWAPIVAGHLARIAQSYTGVLIVPMTLMNEALYDRIIGRLLKNQIHVRHFTLMLRKETLLKRLHSRLEGRHSWAYSQAEDCLKELSKKKYQIHLQMDYYSVEEAVRIIAKQSELAISDTRSPLRKRLDRLNVKLREISLFK